MYGSESCTPLEALYKSEENYTSSKFSNRLTAMKPCIQGHFFDFKNEHWLIGSHTFLFLLIELTCFSIDLLQISYRPSVSCFHIHFVIACEIVCVFPCWFTCFLVVADISLGGHQLAIMKNTLLIWAIDFIKPSLSSIQHSFQ